MIYNIFQISVAGDIRYYGLLKTIGVTPKQLRRLIRQQQREKRVLFGILTFLLIFLLLLYLDATHGAWGAIRYIE